MQPLEQGERLTRDEFERRYEAVPKLKKAELIEGIVYIPSPIGTIRYGSSRAELIGWLGVYGAFTPGVRVCARATIRLDLDNEPQPDATMYIRAAFGGQARIDDEGFLTGGPELVADVVPPNASSARNAKLRVYRRNNVREYIIWRVEDQAIDWFILHQGQYAQLERASDGLLRSEQFAGLWLDPDALLRFDLARVFQVVQQGIASPEHAAFVAQLQQQAGGQS
jgi:hypothetical protein